MNRKRKIEKKPKYIKILVKDIIISFTAALLIFTGIITYMKIEYTRYVNAVRDDINQIIEKEMENQISDIGIDNEEDITYLKSFITNLADTSNKEKLDMLPLLKIFMNMWGKNNAVSPVEIEIYNYDDKFVCSNMAREYNYYARKKDSTRIKYGEINVVIVNTTIRYRVITYYSFWFDCRGGIETAACGLLLLAVLFAGVISSLVYYKKKLQYDTYVYRRNITNSMAHDLKSPLMVISGYTQNLMENEHTEIEQHFLENIVGTVEYMDRIIAKSLELYRLEERDKSSLNKEELNISEIVENVLAKYEKSLSEKGLTAKKEGNCKLVADYTIVENIITNIISNISKYSKEKSEFNINITGKKIIFKNVMAGKIDKNGEELFTPYVKGNKSRTGQNGTGLGLSIVREMCILHGFDVSIVIENDNFVLTICF